MNPVNLYDLEKMVEQRMPHDLWDFVDAAACDEITKQRNRTALDAITVNPRFLVDVSVMEKLPPSAGLTLNSSVEYVEATQMLPAPTVTPLECSVSVGSFSMTEPSS